MFFDSNAVDLVEKAEKAGVREENIHLLPKSIEDCFPKDLCEKFLEETYQIDWKKKDGSKIEKINESLSRVEEIRRILREKHNIRSDNWKVSLGEFAAEKMDMGQLRRETYLFLKRRVIKELRE
ncbi:MAG: hypothetical protein PVF83_11585 [Anaerolineales bacterium]|jgi:hypothetical protein